METKPKKNLKKLRSKGLVMRLVLLSIADVLVRPTLTLNQSLHFIHPKHRSPPRILNDDRFSFGLLKLIGQSRSNIIYFLIFIAQRIEDRGINWIYKIHRLAGNLEKSVYVYLIGAGPGKISRGYDYPTIVKDHNSLTGDIIPRKIYIFPDVNLIYGRQIHDDCLANIIIQLIETEIKDFVTGIGPADWTNRVFQDISIE